MAERGFFAEVEHPEIGKLKYPGVPYRFSGIPREQPASAPLLGQTTKKYIADAWLIPNRTWSNWVKRVLYDEQRFLKGVRVVAMTQVWAGG